MSFLFKKTNEPTITDFKNQKNENCQIKRESILSADRNRWFVISLVLSVITLISVASAFSANKRAQESIKVAWVKLVPDGTWEVEFHDRNRQPEFFQSTIDYLIKQWVERRYSKISHSIKTDYGFCHSFMSPSLKQQFIDSNQFNAPKVAAEIANCSACPEINFLVRTIDHYDSDKTRFGKFDGTLYRSNVFVKRKTINFDGTMKNKPENMIVSLQWRLKAAEEIKADKKSLEHNPIGLEIIDYDLLKDVSGGRG